MNEQIRATAMTVEATAAERGAPAAPLDAWDRLAALAFGDAASAGGCSEHTHDCTCLAENAGAEGIAWPGPVVPDSGHPVHPEPEPEPTPLWTPEPADESEPVDRGDGR